MSRVKWLGALLGVAAIFAGGLTAYRAGALPLKPPPSSPKYVVIAWNNLGMHCYNPDFSNLAILPPYNTLVAQVIKVGDDSQDPRVPAQIVTTGVKVEYSFPDNSYSVGGSGVPPGRPDKTNFWDYAEPLFGVKLEHNIGLTGKGLSGTMDPTADGYFIAEGIPLTDIRDQDAATMTPYPFQKALITVRDAQNPGKVLAQITAVAPVSTELMCANCHSDDMDATQGYVTEFPGGVPTGKVETNILAIHDVLNKDNYATFLAGRPDLLAKTPLLTNGQPVLCAWCHQDNALGMPGVAGIKDMSNAMHRHHNSTNAPDITFDTDGCYNCHPGPDTQCLRDTMCQHFSLNCTDCHNPAGNDVVEPMVAVGQNPAPWASEPKCGQTGCHGAGYDTVDPLYRNSTGHGGVYCEACHDSTHAIAPSREPNDAIKFIQLQGHTGTLSGCTVCHGATPRTRFNH